LMNSRAILVFLASAQLFGSCNIITHQPWKIFAGNFTHLLNSITGSNCPRLLTSLIFILNLVNFLLINL
jgi:hypothetical protein